MTKEQLDTSRFLDISAFDQGAFDGAIIPADRSPDREDVATIAFYKGRCLSDVTVEAIERHHWNSSMHVSLSEEAFIHYLPILMKLGVEHQESDRVGAISDNLTFDLWRMAAGSLEERRVAIVNSYTRRQLHVIVSYLDHIAAIQLDSRVGDQATEALRYWRRLAEQA